VLTRLKYVLAGALRNVRQTPFLFTATVLTVTVSLAMVAVFALLVLNLQRVGSSWGQEIQVVAYFDKVPSQTDRLEWQAVLAKRPEVERVDYIDKFEAYEIFSGQLGEEKALLEGIRPEVLPASLQVTLREPFRTTQTVMELALFMRKDLKMPEVHYGREWVERFESAVSIVRLVALVLGAVLVLTALFIVGNTIRLALYSRRQELEVMSLVGATSLFIRTPFLIEGALQGLIGGALALASLYVVYHLYLLDNLQALLLAMGDFEVLFLPFPLQWGLLLAGLLLGLLGSSLALRRLIRV